MYTIRQKNNETSFQGIRHVFTNVFTCIYTKLKDKRKATNRILYRWYFYYTEHDNLTSNKGGSRKSLSNSCSTQYIKLVFTKSMTTSLPNSALYSDATLQTCITASGSSAFTWKIGHCTT